MDENTNKTENVENNSNEPVKKKGTAKLAIIIILIIAVLAGIGVGIYFLFFSAKTIDLAKYISAEYEGFDGYGTATVDFDSSLKKAFDDSSVYKKFKKKAELEVTSDNNGTLKNGDTIKVKIDISKSWLKDNRLELKDKTVEIKVSGLPEAEEIDVFEDLEFSFDGISPNLYLSVDNNSSNEFIRDSVYYTLSESYDLKNGDTITITANYSEYDAQEMGVIVKDDTMKYKIENQPFYLQEKEDFSENIMSSLNEYMVTEVKDNVDYSKYDVYSKNREQYNPSSYYSDDLVPGEPELVNLYLLTKKDEDSYYSDNYVFGIYKVTYTSTETGAKFDWYFAPYNSDIAATGDDKIYEDDYADYYYCYDGESPEYLYAEYIETESADYDIITVK